ncbi:MAG: sugar transferase [Hasllibacter sp.]
MAPVGLILAGVQLAREGRPVLYRSERIGQGGRPFTLLKFRTMRPAAEDAGASGGHKDAHVTGFGRWLRRTRMDELPQLANILRGDMSLVGPRPPLRRYVEAAPALYAEVLKCRPGLTGLATLAFSDAEARILSGSADANENEALYLRRCVPRKARLDLIYARNRSNALDAWILWRTLRRGSERHLARLVRRRPQ